MKISATIAIVGCLLGQALGPIEPTAANPADAPADAPTDVRVSVQGPVSPPNAVGQQLYLVRYDIPAHTALSPHVHDGTQIGWVESGILTYRVFAGAVPVYEHGPDGQPVQVRTIDPGETGQVFPGQWVVETAEMHHAGANEEDAVLTIYTSTLLEAGAPLATPLPASE